MDFETIDWNAETKRVALAFGITRPVEFVPNALDEETRIVFRRNLYTVGRAPSRSVPLSGGVSLWATYRGYDGFSEGLLYFRVFLTRGMVDGMEILLNWDGSLHAENRKSNMKDVYLFPYHLYYLKFALPLAKGLLHLGLLTEEVEDFLDVSISGHQKIEWALEFDERLRREIGHDL